MTKKLESKSETFSGSTNNEAEEKANKWSSKFLRELRGSRKAWNDIDGTFIVEVTVVSKESVE